MEQRKWANENSAADTPGARTGFHIPHLKWTNENFATDSNEPMRILQLIHLGQKLVCYKSHFKWTNENSAADTPGARTGFSYPTFELNQWELCKWFKWANENSTADTPGARTGFSHPKFEMNQWELCIWFNWANENSAADTPGTKTGFLQITFLNEPMRTLQLILLIQVQM